jgi:probable rRNA maturation factor
VRGGGEALSLAIALSDDAFLRRLNRDFRGRNEATNVLSFPAAPPIAPDQPCHLGDIAIAHQTVLAEAAACAIAPADHLAHMVVHGVLHLLGYDHMTPGEAALMEPLEGAILRRLGIADPYSDDNLPGAHSLADRP